MAASRLQCWADVVLSPVYRNRHSFPVKNEKFSASSLAQCLVILMAVENLWSSEAGMVAFSSYSNCFGGWLLIDGS
jgi:hypothetical protein